MATDPDCKHAPGLFVPFIDANRCEGKEDCLPVCPFNVFEMHTLSVPQRQALSMKGRIKGFFHGYRQAIAVRADACQACGLCVKACPERAITLRRAT